MLLKKIILVSVLILIGIGCSETSKVVIEPPRLIKPVKPTLITIDAVELACLSDVTYRNMVMRQLVIKHYIEELELVIDTYNSNLGGCYGLC